MNAYDKQRTSIAGLRYIGTWATCWWAISGLYVVLLIWQSRERIEIYGWWQGIRQIFDNSFSLQLLLAIVAAGWVAGGLVWLRILRAHKISYAVALKDLFLTIRK